MNPGGWLKGVRSGLILRNRRRVTNPSGSLIDLNPSQGRLNQVCTVDISIGSKRSYQSQLKDTEDIEEEHEVVYDWVKRERALTLEVDRQVETERREPIWEPETSGISVERGKIERRIPSTRWQGIVDQENLRSTAQPSLEHLLSREPSILDASPKRAESLDAAILTHLGSSIDLLDATSPSTLPLRTVEDSGHYTSSNVGNTEVEQGQLAQEMRSRSERGIMKEKIVQAISSSQGSLAEELTQGCFEKVVAEKNDASSAEGNIPAKSAVDSQSPGTRAARIAIESLHPATFISTSALPPATLLRIFDRLHHEDTSPAIVKLSRTNDISPHLSDSLDLLDALGTVRQERSLSMYEIVISHCISARRPDLAAIIYVGLVEEWIMEGRIAEGGEQEDFREGGGPSDLRMEGIREDHLSRLEADKAQRMEKERLAKEEKRDRHLARIAGGSRQRWGRGEIARAAQLQTTKPPDPRISDEEIQERKSSVAERNGWFQGVRAWRLPGERLTPSERLDLWHPKKLALHEKLRNFPIPSPTSPPTLVPPPDLKCLKLILAGISYDHNQDFDLYVKSSRALAMLANTVLARTLPIMGVGCLIDAFRKMNYNAPEVYPVGFEPISTGSKDSYSFSAYAHAYRALMSFVYEAPTLTLGNSARSLASLYRLPPLNTQACHSILHWIMTVAKKPFLTKPILRYMKNQNNGITAITTTTYNILYRGGILTRDFFLAERMRSLLFGDERSSALSPAAAAYVPEPGTNVVPTRTTPQDLVSLPPDDYSLSAKFAHLTATGKREEIYRETYRIYPFLDTRSYPEIPTDASPDLIQKERERRYRLVKSVANHSGHVFSACLGSLRSIRDFGLAERLYQLGRRCDDNPNWKWMRPIEAYTTMLLIYDDVAKWTRHDDESVNKPANHLLDGRRKARQIFRDAINAVGRREHHQEADSGSRKSRPIPDLIFLQAFLRHVPLRESQLSPPIRNEDGIIKPDRVMDVSLSLFQLEMIMYTATVWDVPHPPIWNERYSGLTDLLKEMDEEGFKSTGKYQRPSLTDLVRRTDAWLWPEFRDSLKELLPEGWERGESKRRKDT